VFDNTPPSEAARSKGPAAARGQPEDERIALRCNRKELQLLDSFVATGEFSSRSELMRQALRDFLRARAMTGIPPAPTPDARGLVEVSVRLRPEEVETLSAYGELVENGEPLGDLLAKLVRRAELELKVSELVARARASVRDAAESRARLGALQRHGEELERKGVVGR
jgi:hypothetical protein